MKTTVKVLAAFALVAFFAVFVVTAAAQQPAASPAIVLHFRTAKRLMLVDVNVNGIPATLVLDTGAISSLIAPSLAGQDAKDYAAMKQGTTGQGFTGQAIETEASFCVAGLAARERVFAGNVDLLSKRTGVHVDGLLGQDVLRHFKSFRIDYQHSIIELAF